MGETLQFTAYHPNYIRPLVWQSLVVFAHRNELYQDAEGKIIDPAAQVKQAAQTLIGPSISQYSDAGTSSTFPIMPGSTLTIKPRIAQATFIPESISLEWEEAYRHVEFQFALPETAVGRAIPGLVQIFHGILLVGEIQFAIFVGNTAVDEETARSTTASSYRKIFASYSHSDTAVVRSMVRHVRTTGDTYLIDVNDLRAGEVWSNRLEQLIKEADVFQLFWSKNSMRSPFVRSEWEYALSLLRKEFVRPVHWEIPLPIDDGMGLPPAELRSIHFATLVIDDDSWLDPAEPQARPGNASSTFRPIPGNSRPHLGPSPDPDSFSSPQGSARSDTRPVKEPARLRNWKLLVAVVVAGILIGIVAVVLIHSFG